MLGTQPVQMVMEAFQTVGSTQTLPFGHTLASPPTVSVHVDTCWIGVVTGGNLQCCGLDFVQCCFAQQRFIGGGIDICPELLDDGQKTPQQSDPRRPSGASHIAQKHRLPVFAAKCAVAKRAANSHKYQTKNGSTAIQMTTAPSHMTLPSTVFVDPCEFARTAHTFGQSTFGHMRTWHAQRTWENVRPIHTEGSSVANKQLTR